MYDISNWNDYMYVRIVIIDIIFFSVILYYIAYCSLMWLVQCPVLMLPMYGPDECNKITITITMYHMMWWSAVHFLVCFGYRLSEGLRLGYELAG